MSLSLTLTLTLSVCPTTHFPFFHSCQAPSRALDRTHFQVRCNPQARTANNLRFVGVAKRPRTKTQCKRSVRSLRKRKEGVGRSIWPTPAESIGGMFRSSGCGSSMDGWMGWSRRSPTVESAKCQSSVGEPGKPLFSCWDHATTPPSFIREGFGEFVVFLQREKKKEKKKKENLA
ncbi:hypothetical protein DFJ73DRAFT_832956 [Zopfochytrium polystomum]|nr:hypothetical protein DFJ73DRAFT_832956 [Zopfochytrium polystomum]